MYWIRGLFPRGGTLLPKSDYSGHCSLRLGVAQFPPASVSKKISVIHYLQSLTPVPVWEGPFAVVAEPTPAWIAIPSLIVVTALVLLLAGRRIRRMEISYGSD